MTAPCFLLWQKLSTCVAAFAAGAVLSVMVLAALAGAFIIILILHLNQTSFRK